MLTKTMIQENKSLLQAAKTCKSSVAHSTIHYKSCMICCVNHARNYVPSAKTNGLIPHGGTHIHWIVQQYKTTCTPANQGDSYVQTKTAEPSTEDTTSQTARQEHAKACSENWLIQKNIWSGKEQHTAITQHAKFWQWYTSVIYQHFITQYLHYRI